MKTPNIFTRYRSHLDQYVAQYLAAQSGYLPRLIEYHFGLRDNAGRIENKTRTLGKSLRPILCLHTVSVLRGDWYKVIPIAVALELIHNATLIHDDIADHDKFRHERPALWCHTGTASAIHAGDWLFLLAFNLIQQSEYSISLVQHITEELNKTTRKIMEGQFLDASFEKRLDVTDKEYMLMIENKTAALFVTSFQVGSYLAGASKDIQKACSVFGRALGMIFQLTDDYINIWGDQSRTVKANRGDIQRKKKTFPIIIAFMSTKEKLRLAELFRKKSELNNAEITETLDILEKINAREKTKEKITYWYNQAIEIIPEFCPGAYKTEYTSIVDFFAKRQY